MRRPPKPLGNIKTKSSLIGNLYDFAVIFLESFEMSQSSLPAFQLFTEVEETDMTLIAHSLGALFVSFGLASVRICQCMDCHISVFQEIPKIGGNLECLWCEHNIESKKKRGALRDGRA